MTGARLPPDCDAVVPLERVAELNPQLRHTQFADFHGHGWVFRAVFKRDRRGMMLDHQNRPLGEVENAQLQAAVAIPQYVQQLYRNRDWDDAQTLAEQCIASMGVDQIFHGARPGAPASPNDVELLFFNFQNVEAARTNGRQSAIDEVQRARLFTETGAVVRVLIDSTDGDRAWSTVGVSENIIEASWQALVDSMVYGLLHASDRRL